MEYGINNNMSLKYLYFIKSQVETNLIDWNKTNNTLINTYFYDYLQLVTILIQSVKSKQIYRLFNHRISDSIPVSLNNPKSYEFKKGFYINLKESTERKQNIDQTDFYINMERFEAIKHNEGNIGCSMSHISLLKHILSSEQGSENAYYLIVEDDIEITSKDKYRKMFINITNVIQYYLPDMIILAGTKKIIAPEKYYGFGFYKLLKANTTCAYIISYKFIPTLIDKFETGLNNLLTMKDISTHNTENTVDSNCKLISELTLNLNACDQIWNNNIVNENWVTYYDFDTISPNFKFHSTISEFETDIIENSRNDMLKNEFNSCIILNENNLLLKYFKYHQLYDTFYNIIRHIEKNSSNNNIHKIIYTNQLINN